MDRDQALRYLRDPYHCPYCGKNSLSSDTMDPESGVASITCDDCNEEWNEVYTLNQVDDHGFRDVRIVIEETNLEYGYGTRVQAVLKINDDIQSILDICPMTIDDRDATDDFVDHWVRVAEDNYIPVTDIRESEEDDQPILNIYTLDEAIEAIIKLVPIGDEEKAREILGRTKPVTVTVDGGVAYCTSDWVTITDNDSLEENEGQDESPSDD